MTSPPAPAGRTALWQRMAATEVYYPHELPAPIDPLRSFAEVPAIEVIAAIGRQRRQAGR